MEADRSWAPSRRQNPRGFDEGGVLWWLGTAGGTRPWRNPSEAGAVAVRCTAALDAGTAAGFVGRRDTNNFTVPADEVAVTIVLPRALAPTHYTLKHGWANAFGSLRNWELLGSNDGVEFTVLREHRDDDRLDAGYATVTWAVAAPPGLAYTQFRVRVTGPNKAGDNSLWLAGIELYGRSAVEADSSSSIGGIPDSGGAAAAAAATTGTDVAADAAARLAQPIAIGTGGSSGLQVAPTATAVPAMAVAATPGWQRPVAVLVAVLSAALWQADVVLDAAAAAFVGLGQQVDAMGKWMAGRHEVIAGSVSLLGVDVVLLAVAGTSTLLTAVAVLRARRRRQQRAAAPVHTHRLDLAQAVEDAAHGSPFTLSPGAAPGTPARGRTVEGEEQDGVRGRYSGGDNGGGGAGDGGGGTAAAVVLPPLPSGTMLLPDRAVLLRRWVTEAEAVVASAHTALRHDAAHIHARHAVMIVQHGRDQQLAVDGLLQTFNLLVAEEADCRDQEIERVHREAKGHLANAAATLRCLRVEAAEAARAGTFLGWLFPRPIVYGGNAGPGEPDTPDRRRQGSSPAPQEFRCGLSGDVMADPVIAQCGHSFERRRLEASLQRRRRCPECQVNIPGPPTPNHSLRATIDRWNDENRTTLPGAS